MSHGLHLVSNNVKGIGARQKRLKIFKYLSDLAFNNGIIFMQETHSSATESRQWERDFGADMYFSHGTTGACGVAIGILINDKHSLLKKVHDKSGRFLILEIEIKNKIFILINLYNANFQADQVKTLSELDDALNNFDLCPSKSIIFGGDFNIIFNKNLDAKGGNPTLKLNSIAKLIKLKESMDLIDIWRIRNPLKKGIPSDSATILVSYKEDLIIFLSLTHFSNPLLNPKLQTRFLQTTLLL